MALRPDLVIGFSDLQAAIAQELIKAGVNVVVFNQRSIGEIFETILMLARVVAAEVAGIRLADRLRGELAQIADAAGKFPAGCPYTLDQILTDDWYPTPPGETE